MRLYPPIKTMIQQCNKQHFSSTQYAIGLGGKYQPALKGSLGDKDAHQNVMVLARSKAFKN